MEVEKQNNELGGLTPFPKQHLLVVIFLICLNIPLLVFSDFVASGGSEERAASSGAEVMNPVKVSSLEESIRSLSGLIDQLDSMYAKFRAERLTDAEKKEFWDLEERLLKHLDTLGSEVRAKPLTEAEKAMIHTEIRKLIDRPPFRHDRLMQIMVVDILQTIPDQTFNNWIIDNIFVPESNIEDEGLLPRAAQAVAKSKDTGSIDRAIKVLLEHYLRNIEKKKNGVNAGEEMDRRIQTLRGMLASLAGCTIGTLLDESSRMHGKIQHYIGYTEAEELLGIFANAEMVNETRRQWVASGDAHLKAILEAFRCSKHIGNEISDELFMRVYLSLELKNWEKRQGVNSVY